jgi:hypothetical protein
LVLDESEGLNKHISLFDALVYLIDDEIKITIAGKTYIVKRGERVNYNTYEQITCTRSPKPV